MPDPIPLEYSPQPPRSSLKGPIAILIALALFAARVATLNPPSKGVPSVPAPIPVVPARIALDMNMGNSLSHDAPGPNDLYVLSYSMPTTQPAYPETRGTNSNAWLDNIYTVQTTTLTTRRGVVSGVPYDDKDSIMLPTSN